MSQILDVDYAYNGRRERVRRTPGGPLVADDPAAGGGIETRHYDEDGRLLAQHRSGGAVFEYLYLDGEPIAFVRSAGTYGGGTKTLYYHHTDHLGTPRRATDQARAVKWFSVEPYDPFDMLAVSYILGPGMTFPALRFAGQSTDEMTPFFYNYYRDYDPFKGSYLQSDPIGLAGGINTYAYVENNPQRFVDLYGLAIGDFPPPPPGYSPSTWQHGTFDNGRHYVFDPEGRTWIAHPEDKHHWRHWDVYPPDDGGNGGGKTRWPPNSKKGWPNQKKFKPDQCPTDPNGNEEPWAPTDEQRYWEDVYGGVPFPYVIDGMPSSNRNLRPDFGRPLPPALRTPVIP